jgi:flagellar FliJ protein
VKRFVFRLERVQRLRQREEERAVIALGAARRTLGEATARRDALLQERADLDRSWQEAVVRTGAQAATVRDFASYRTALQARIVAAEEALEKAARAEQEARGALEKARRRCRILEKLRERQEARHREAVLKEDQQVLDEAGARGIERRRTERRTKP